MTIKTDQLDIQMPLFQELPMQKININNVLSPETYNGLSSFHKYWGKKPTESFSFLIQLLTSEKEIILDPFLGSGLIARESALLNRKFIGVDINPFSIELSELLLSLPKYEEYLTALNEMEKTIKPIINKSYIANDNRIASHYLWEKKEIQAVWVKIAGKRKDELLPNDIDYKLFNGFESYKPRNLRNIHFFTNSRINANPALSLKDIFTGRALYNIDILLDYINTKSNPLKRALLLTLTSASGQMSNMVFAIKNRTKNKNNGINRIEVGSWVIGFWRPDTHFEINVWNCFFNRAEKFINTLRDLSFYNNFDYSNEINDLYSNNKAVVLINGDCKQALDKIKANSITLICTDPPHSDRMPYLELSELWNSILGYESNFKDEIVVSNAKERSKSKSQYKSDMDVFFQKASNCLKENGVIAIYFNARDKESWEFLKSIDNSAPSLKYIGCFPMVYSASSVVQDNRAGGMKHDYVLIYQKVNNGTIINDVINKLNSMPNWSSNYPEK